MAITNSVFEGNIHAKTHKISITGDPLRSEELVMNENEELKETDDY